MFGTFVGDGLVIARNLRRVEVVGPQDVDHLIPTSGNIEMSLFQGQFSPLPEPPELLDGILLL